MTAQSSELFSGLEQHLQRSLRPVQPNPEFVHRLHHHLATPGTTVMVGTSRAPFALLVALGVSLGVVVIWALRKFRS